MGAIMPALRVMSSGILLVAAEHAGRAAQEALAALAVLKLWEVASTRALRASVFRFVRFHFGKAGGFGLGCRLRCACVGGGLFWCPFAKKFKHPVGGGCCCHGLAFCCCVLKRPRRGWVVG